MTEKKEPEDKVLVDFLSIIHDVENIANQSGLNWSYVA